MASQSKRIFTAPEMWRTMVEVMATQPAAIRRLLDTHVAAANGRCAACTRAGYGTPEKGWPCAPRQLADDALRLVQERRSE